jgi:DNA repair protein RecO (recombination protein O)
MSLACGIRIGNGSEAPDFQSSIYKKAIIHLMSFPTFNLRGIVIKRWVLPNQDVMLYLLTPSGKIKVVARKAASSNMQSKVNLFQDLHVQLQKKPGDIHMLLQVTLEGALPRLITPQRYAYAHVIAELVDLLLPDNQALEGIFELFVSTLRGLATHPDPEWVAQIMLFRLLGISGFAPYLIWPDHDLPPRFNLKRGGFSSDEGITLEPQVALFLCELNRHTVRELLDFTLEPHNRTQLWNLLERYVGHHIGTLKSWNALGALTEV